MRNLLKELDGVLGKLEMAKNQAKKAYNLETLQGTADWLSLMGRINYIERHVYDLMNEVISDEKIRIESECCKCED